MFLGPTVPMNVVVDIPVSQIEIIKSTPDLVIEYAEKYNVSPYLMSQIIHCESYGNPNEIGDNGTSFGLVQIHLPAHPEVTKEQALDREFSIDFLARHLSMGEARIWSCYNIVKDN